MAQEDRRVSLVTGGVRGLGLAVARKLCARGDRVHVGYRSSVDLAGELADEFGERLLAADLEQPEAAERCVAAVLERDGRLDHVVHAVGEFVAGPIETLEPADLRRMFSSNVETAFCVARAARGELRRTRGSLTFFGQAGLASLRARRETAAYTAAKTALLVLAKSLALEEAPHGVRVNLVSPGVVPHPHAAPETHDEERLARIPMGRAGTPEEVAEAVCWLASDAAGYTTGVDLEVSGGWLL